MGHHRERCGLRADTFALKKADMDSIITDQRRWERADVARLLVGRNALTELGLEDAMKVVALMESRRVKAGTKLVQEGTSNTGYMVLVLRGDAVVEQDFVKRSDSLVLNVVGPGHVIGEMGLLDGEPRSATCTAASEMDVAVLSRDNITQLIQTEPRAACNLLAALLARTSERLRNSNKKVRTLTQVNRSLQQELNAFQGGGHSHYRSSDIAPLGK